VEAVFKGSVDQVRLDEPKYEELNGAGYKFAQAFCGTMPEALSPHLTNCHVIFEYASASPGGNKAAADAALKQ
jgi:hypothetical protein